jgi:hypothetical protein
LCGGLFACGAGWHPARRLVIGAKHFGLSPLQLFLALHDLSIDEKHEFLDGYGLK